jgi:hypothetical protein
MNEKKLLENKVINFFFKKDEYKSLSNFWSCIIQINDEGNVRKYANGESCFHGEKFIRVAKHCKDENRKKELLDYSKLFLKGECIQDGNQIKKWDENLF